MALKLPSKVGPRRAHVAPGEGPGVVAATPAQALRVESRHVDPSRRLGLRVSNERRQRQMRRVTHDYVYVVRQYGLSVHADGPAASRIEHRLVAMQLQAASAGSQFGKTNLQDFLAELRAREIPPR